MTDQPKPLTQKEFARLGALATNSKYPKSQRSEWAKKGPEALKAKYGPDYFKQMALKRELAKRQKKENNTEETSLAEEVDRK